MATLTEQIQDGHKATTDVLRVILEKKEEFKKKKTAEACFIDELKEQLKNTYPNLYDGLRR